MPKFMGHAMPRHTMPGQKQTGQKMPGQAKPFSVSQNFLTSRRTIDRLLALTDISGNDTVLEIGAGKGHITKALLDKGGFVMATEIDGKLYAALKGSLAGNEKLQLRNADFLKCTLPNKPYKVFSNIPFSITTAIVRKLTEAANPPTDAWLVMEKGAAKRFCGSPRENLSSLLLKPFFDLRIIYHFRREDFHPAPGVDIVLVHLARRDKPDIPRSQYRAYSNFVSACLKNGLFSSKSPLTKRQISVALRLAGLEPIEPSGDILYIQWLCLFRCFLSLQNR